MIELLTNEQMGRADKLAIASGIAGIELMETAGRAVADAVSARFDSTAQVLVCAGPGNNGGDGFIAARLLRERGYPVRLMLLGDRTKLRGDAAEAARRFDGDIESPGAVRATVVVDALFGAGLDRPVEGVAAGLIEAINASGAAVVAVDLPSGVNGDSGAVMGVAVRAQATVTFFRRKPAHLLLPGRALCGAIGVADIGIPAAVLEEIAPRTFANEPPLWLSQVPVPRPDGHKYDRGHAVVVSGDLSHTGAARLAARAALRAGAGLVTLASPKDALAVNAAASLAVMVREAEGAEGLTHLLSDARINALVLGPAGGVGAEMRAKVAAGLQGRRAVVLDADALTSFADDPQALLTLIADRPESPVILTPHEGEFSRLFSKLSDISSIKLKLEATKIASYEAGAVVVLKGGDTVIAAPDGRAAIAGNAPAFLATAGAGDVLAGMIGGLCAQEMPPFEAAAAAVWMHGEAANAVGPGLIAEDLPEALPRVLANVLRCLNRG
jgi:hydroxyethylthiazole kinase-like uncharacterized protein yjeF